MFNTVINVPKCNKAITYSEVINSTHTFNYGGQEKNVTIK